MLPTCLQVSEFPVLAFHCEPVSGGDTLRRVVSDDNNNAQGGGSPCSTRYLQSTMHKSVVFLVKKP